jgi:hypothetical protein
MRDQEGAVALDQMQQQRFRIARARSGCGPPRSASPFPIQL